MTQRLAVTSPDAPPALGPYSQAMIHSGLVWCSGQLGLDPISGELVDGGVEAQAVQALKNLQAVCAAAGTSLDQAIRCTIYLTDLADFATVNRCYAAVLREPFPARACVQVAALPKGGVVEIDAVVPLATSAN